LEEFGPYEPTTGQIQILPGDEEPQEFWYVEGRREGKEKGEGRRREEKVGEGRRREEGE
jgi:hypothetical protein